MIKVLIIDSQGGGLGKQIISSLKEKNLEIEITAVGTNSFATANMLKVGPNIASTGENAIKVACRNTDIIIGPAGIAIPDSLMGEVTPKMAKAVGKSNAQRILIPFNNCGNYFVGLKSVKLNTLVEQAVEKVLEIIKIV